MIDSLTEASDISANDLLLAKDMADVLNTQYPGHLWAVNVDGKQGMADIRNLALSGDWGYRLRIVTNFSASEFRKRVIRAGGEILERFGQRRGAMDDDRISDIPSRHGRLLGDYSR